MVSAPNARNLHSLIVIVCSCSHIVEWVFVRDDNYERLRFSFTYDLIQLLSMPMSMFDEELKDQIHPDVINQIRRLRSQFDSRDQVCVLRVLLDVYRRSLILCV